MKAKIILQPKYNLSCGPASTVKLPNTGVRTPAPVNYATGKKCLRGMAYYEWLEKVIFSREYRVT